ncbi:MAG: hypothetical protein GYA24_18930 [Candidatus Lokiarchaeota archaeon]|nr:hypothetical protein [Candidatus Lokiarchaeota archaeon]
MQASKEAGTKGDPGTTIARFQAADRLPTIDFMRHISMFFVFYCHFMVNWRAPEFTSWLLFQWTILDFLGITSFTGLSVIGNMLSYYKRVEKGDTRIVTPALLTRAACLYAVAVPMNFVAQGYMGGFVLLMGNVLTIIAIFSLLTPVVLQLDWRIRAAILGMLVASYYPLVSWAWGGLLAAGISPEGIQAVHLADPRVFVYYALVDHRMTAPLFTWLPIVFFVTIVFERFVKTQGKLSREGIARELRRIAVIGAIIAVASAIAGSTPSQGYIAGELANLTHPGFYFTWPVDWIPMFFVRNSTFMVVYNFGMFCLTFWFFGTIQLVHGKRFPAQEKLMNFGKLSLTGFLLSHIPYAIQIQIPFWPFYAIFIPIYILIIECFWRWTTRLRGVGTVEWVITIASSFVTKTIERKRRVDEQGTREKTKVMPVR